MSRRHGLTLVELLIAAGLAGALALTIALGLQAGLRTGTALSRTSQAEHAVRLLARLEQDLASALPDDTPGFTGSELALSLSRRIVDGPEGIPAVARVEWSFDPVTQTVRREVRFIPASLSREQPPPGAPPAETYPVRRTLRFTYLPPETDPDAGVPAWPPPVLAEDAPDLPAAVLAELDGSRRLLPLFAAHVARTGPTRPPAP